MSQSEILLGLPGYQITGIQWIGGEVRIAARHEGPICCPHCQGSQLRNKGRYVRRIRHEDCGPASPFRRPSTVSTSTASTAAGWESARASAPPPWSATFNAICAASLASGIRPAARRFWASMSTSSPAVKGLRPPCAISKDTRSMMSCWAARRIPWSPIYSAWKVRQRSASSAWTWPLTLPRFGSQALPQGHHRSRPLPCHPAHQSPLLNLLAKH